MKCTIKRLAVVLTAMLLSLSCGGSYADSLYVSDLLQSTVTKFDAVTGAFQQVLITGGASLPDRTIPANPNGIVVNGPVSSPELVVAFQNVNASYGGDIQVFDEA